MSEGLGSDSRSVVPGEDRLGPIPRVPLILGLSGLLPFWALAILHVAGRGSVDPALSGVVLASYAATILSFLGGIRWGALSARPDQSGLAVSYVGSVVPQLFGWAALALADPWRLLLLGAAILLTGPLDRRLAAQGLLPHWMGRLRLILSVGASAALIVAGLA